MRVVLFLKIGGRGRAKQDQGRMVACSWQDAVTCGAARSPSRVWSRI